MKSAVKNTDIYRGCLGEGEYLIPRCGQKDSEANNESYLEPLNLNIGWNSLVNNREVEISINKEKWVVVKIRNGGISLIGGSDLSFKEEIGKDSGGFWKYSFSFNSCVGRWRVDVAVQVLVRVFVP